MPNPYRLYSEHKFVSIQVSDLERHIAVLDFTDLKQIAELKTRLEGLIGLMENHAKHEDERIHPLLKAKGSKVIDEIERDHKDHKLLFDKSTRKQLIDKLGVHDI